MIVREGGRTRKEGRESPEVRGDPAFYEVMGRLDTEHLSRHPEHYPLLGKIVVQSWRK